MKNDEIIVGIDPSIRSTGICVWTGSEYKYFLIPAAPTKKLLNFKAPNFDISPYEPESVKDKTSIGKEYAITTNIEQVVNRVTTIISIYNPKRVVIESCAFAAAGRVADLSGLNHCIRLACRRLGVEVFAVPPTTNKMVFTGNGQATKEMMVTSWVACDSNVKTLLKVGKGAEDLADAYALCNFPEELLKIR